MKIIGLSILAALAVLYSGGAGAGGDSVFGFWLIESQHAIIEIAPCAEKACGNIVWLSEPLDDDGRPKLDHNDDDEPRGRPLCGIELISGFRNTGSGVWSGGSIYNPRDGQFYSASMELRDNDTLRLRGYFLLPLFGRSRTWTREAGDRGGC